MSCSKLRILIKAMHPSEDQTAVVVSSSTLSSAAGHTAAGLPKLSGPPATGEALIIQHAEACAGIKNLSAFSEHQKTMAAPAAQSMVLSEAPALKESSSAAGHMALSVEAIAAVAAAAAVASVGPLPTAEASGADPAYTLPPSSRAGLFEPKRKSCNRRWTGEEDEKLKAAVEANGARYSKQAL